MSIVTNQVRSIIILKQETIISCHLERYWGCANPFCAVLAISNQTRVFFHVPLGHLGCSFLGLQFFHFLLGFWCWSQGLITCPKNCLFLMVLIIFKCSATSLELCFFSDHKGFMLHFTS